MITLARVRFLLAALVVGIVCALAFVTARPGSALPELDYSIERACPPQELPRAGFLDTGLEPTPADCLAWYDIAAGTTAITFSPSADVTRGQVASFAVRVANSLDAVTLPTGDTSFPDVTAGPHRDAIETLASLDPPVIDGYTDGTFGPGDPVTRGQFSTILARTMDAIADRVDDLDRLEAASSGFPDTDDNVHEDGIARLTEVGIIQGYPDGTFRPSTSITRHQVATMFSRAMGGFADAALLEPPAPDPEPDLSVAVTLTPVSSSNAPIGGALGPDGIVYVADRAGTVHRLTDDGLGPAIIDIRDETSVGGERGLLGIAFSSDARELYLSFTDTAGDSVIDAFAVRDGTVRGDERRTVLTQTQPASNHNGGHLVVGPDGMLYIGFGDGGGAGDPQGAGQDRSTMLGSLVRIDPRGSSTYRVPSDNPFVGVSGVRPEIWAYGLRNPWRYEFDRATGDLWIADVGQSEREEVNHLPASEGAGANLGWNLMEGTLPFAGSEPDDHWPPIYEYDTRGPEGCAITGGTVYRGEAIPSLRGVYLYSDFCNGEVRGLILEDGEVAQQASLGVDGGSVVSFAEDADGEIYVFDLNGTIHRLDPA